MHPKIQLQKDHLDHALEVVGLIGVVILLVLPLYYFSSLPSEMPIHFNMEGVADDYGPKLYIWILPIIGIACYLGLWKLCQYPHVFNYPTKITDKNARGQYKMAIRLVRIINVFTVWTFLYTTYATIQTGLGNSGGLGNSFIYIFLAVTVGIPMIYMFNSARSKKG